MALWPAARGRAASQVNTWPHRPALCRSSRKSLPTEGRPHTALPGDGRTWSRRMERSAPSQFSDVHLLGDRERVVHLDTEVTHGAFYLRMAKQKLDRSEV